MLRPRSPRGAFRASRPVAYAAALAGLSLVAVPLGAQARLLPSTTGFSVAGAAALAQVHAETQGTSVSSTGIAPRAELAYGVTPRVSLVAAVAFRSATLQSDRTFDVRNVEMGLRYLARAGTTLRPFAEGGLAVRVFSLDSDGDDITSTNTGPWVAAGVSWCPRGQLAIDMAATYGSVTFESWKVGGAAPALAPLDYREVGVRAGARWYFRSR